MCGIAGIFAYDRSAAPVDQGELLAIREQMRPRGPDGYGLWTSDDGQVGLAQRRLAIIDLSEGGAQPMHDPDNGNTIVFNGEIFNYAELRRDLERAGVRLRSHSDTEVLLKLFGREGPKMLGRLRGMFAFAVWNDRTRRLFLARDPFGIKPLYIADDGRSLRFASQVKALLKGRVDTSPDPAGHAGFLLWGSVPDPFTLYRGIRSVPAGHWFEVDSAGLGPSNEFDSPLQRLAEAEAALSESRQEALERAAEAVRASVTAHMVSDVPVGVFLSAGLDSTMIAAAAAAAGDLRTVTLGFDEYAGTLQDEVPLAEAVARQLNASHAVHRITARDFEADHDRLLGAMDQPSVDGVNSWFVSKAAAANGLKVVLSGLGGDELFGSYPSFRQLPALRSWMSLPSRLPGLGAAVRHSLMPWIGRFTSPKYAGVVEFGGTLEGAYLLRRALFMPWELAGVMDPDMASAGLESLDTLNRLRACSAPLKSERRRISALEMQWYMRNQLLRDADWAGMAHSIEIRVPLVDPVLTGLVANLEGLATADIKRSVARLVGPNLPTALWSRQKTGFAIPTQRWMGMRADGADRSHRGWALHVHRVFTGNASHPATRPQSSTTS